MGGGVKKSKTKKRHQNNLRQKERFLKVRHKKRPGPKRTMSSRTVPKSKAPK